MFHILINQMPFYKSITRNLCAIFIILAVASCSKSGNDQTNTQQSNSNISDSNKVVKEAFLSNYNDADNVDSPTFWQGSNGENWLIATSKSKNDLIIYDAFDGKLIKRFGKTGNAPGEFLRPNGIFTIDNLCLVVERDNKRVQILQLPDFKPLGFIASDRLSKPYGLWVNKDTAGYNLFITDLHADEDLPMPADSILAQSVLQYKFNITDGVLNSHFIRYVGEKSGTGVTKIVESIVADPVNDNLFIAEEMPGATFINVYGLTDGKFRNQTIGQGIYKYQAEGFTIFDCGNGSGFIIGTDQDKKNNTFHVFDRKTFKYLGSFHGETVQNTDGVWLTQISSPKFPNGVLYAVNNDGGVAAFNWNDIATKLNLKCGN